MSLPLCLCSHVELIWVVLLVFMGPGEYQQSQCEILRRDYKLEEKKPSEEKEK